MDSFSKNKEIINISKKNINTELNMLIDLIIDLDKPFTKNNKTFNELTDKLITIKEKIFKLNINIYRLELLKTNWSKKEINELSTKFTFIQDNYKILDKYNKKILDEKNHKAIKLLSIITSVGIPLSIITGYFGMNFESMQDSIFKIKYGQLFVFGLFGLFAILFVLLFYFNVIK